MHDQLYRITWEVRVEGTDSLGLKGPKNLLQRFSKMILVGSWIWKSWPYLAWQLKSQLLIPQQAYFQLKHYERIHGNRREQKYIKGKNLTRYYSVSCFSEVCIVSNKYLSSNQSLFEMILETPLICIFLHNFFWFLRVNGEEKQGSNVSGMWGQLSIYQM